MVAASLLLPGAALGTSAGGTGGGVIRTAAGTPDAAAELAALRARLAAATAEADALRLDLLSAAARTATVRVALDRVAEEREAAQGALDRRVRQVYMTATPGPLRALEVALSSDSARLLAEAAEGGVGVDEALVRAAAEESAELAALRAQADGVRADLLARSEQVYAAQERARDLLVVAEAAAAEAARRAADEAARAAAAAAAAEVDAARAALAEQSAAVTLAVAPGVTGRGRRAAADQAPVVALLEETQRRSPGALPAGFRATGEVVVGEASWYGPGFVGSPTASGSPYDPERLTAAMLHVPLGTVVRVTRPDGRAVCVLVTDRGPYAAGRVLDLSQAAMRELGRFGVGDVRVEVLAPA